MSFAIEGDFGPEDTPVKVLAGVRYTPAEMDVIRWRENKIQEDTLASPNDDELDIMDTTESSILEIYSGILIRPSNRPKFVPFIACGITYLLVDSEATWMSQNPNTPGEQVSSSDDKTLAGFISSGSRRRTSAVCRLSRECPDGCAYPAMNSEEQDHHSQEPITPTSK